MFTERPWGSYTILGENPVAVKVITVNPESRLSLQSHDSRSEIWFALESGLVAWVEGRRIEMQPFKRVRVGTGEKHRIENPTDIPLMFVELMYGVYDENDIFRFEDDYGRS